MANMVRRYQDLIRIPTFEERYEYLRLNGVLCNETFGFDRYLNQHFYNSAEWRNVRNSVILRDNGCDLGCKDHAIMGQIYIHHMNPISVETLIENPEIALDPNYLVCVSRRTHDAIHYGTQENLEKDYVPRQSGDTCPWRR